MNTKTKCLCGAPVASWNESPAARSANLCKPCCDIYLAAGRLCEVKSQAFSVPELPAPDSGDFIVWGRGGYEGALEEFHGTAGSLRKPC